MMKITLLFVCDLTCLSFIEVCGTSY